jgi:hypothetical protein
MVNPKNCQVEWNELTGHPKDRGKDRPNSRTNSLQQGENDVVGKHGEFSQTRAVTKARPDGPITVRTRSFSREGTKRSVRSPFGPRPNAYVIFSFIYFSLESRSDGLMSRPDA